jgi:3-methyladenine DNA glycosylase/8-oxoguanine DNA glycosylase
VEAVRQGVYYRTIALRKGDRVYRGWIGVTNLEEKKLLLVSAAPSLLPVLAKLLGRVRRLFDLDANPAEIDERLSGMNALVPGLMQPGTRLPGAFDPFEMGVRAVLGQQITVKAARTLAGRIAATLGTPAETPFADLNRFFPNAQTIAGIKIAQLASLGITAFRSRSIIVLAKALNAGHINLSPRADPTLETRKLLDLPGFGPWTVSYIAMRALSWPDAFPHTDYGIRKALADQTDQEILALPPPVENSLGPLGITRLRAHSIAALAEALVTGTISLAPPADPEAEMEKLLKLPGFGPWTVNYIALRTLGWPDAFPHTDYGIKKALSGRSPDAILSLAQAWRPWRAYAAVNLWNSLEVSPNGVPVGEVSP